MQSLGGCRWIGTGCVRRSVRVAGDPCDDFLSAFPESASDGSQCNEGRAQQSLAGEGFLGIGGDGFQG